MNVSTTFAALAAVTFATSSSVFAEDVRVTCTGTVASITNGGVATAPFAGATVGEAVTLTVDIEITNQLPFGEALGAINSPTSSMSIGTSSDGFDPLKGQQYSLGDNTVQYGDYLYLASHFSTDSSTRFQLFLSDPSNQTWATGDISALSGTAVQAAGLTTIFEIWSGQGGVTFDLDTVQFDAAPGGVLGSPYCAANPNSTGATGQVSAYGLDTVADNDLNLIASSLPTQTVGYFLVSATQGFVANAGGSEGNLCLSGAVGRFVGPGQVKATDFGGEISLALDLSELPSPTGPIMVQAGQTWNFQLWHRDTSGTGATSNFTSGLSVVFS